MTVKTDLELYQQAFTRYLTVSNFTSSKTADQSFVIQPIGRATVAAGKARGGNPLGLSAAKQNCKFLTFLRHQYLTPFRVQLGGPIHPPRRRKARPERNQHPAKHTAAAGQSQGLASALYFPE